MFFNAHGMLVDLPAGGELSTQIFIGICNIASGLDVLDDSLDLFGVDHLESWSAC